jgi:hypothetical protein
MLLMALIVPPKPCPEVMAEWQLLFFIQNHTAVLNEMVEFCPTFSGLFSPSNPMLFPAAP